MPTLGTMRLPLPKNADEFEEIVADALRARWRAELNIYGRKGQAQEGVDICGDVHPFGMTGVQCKNYWATDLNISIIEKEIAKAEKFRPELHAFYLATTKPRDAGLHAEVLKLSKARMEVGKFPVGVFFWDDIHGDLAKDKAALAKHYPELAVDVDGRTVEMAFELTGADGERVVVGTPPFTFTLLQTHFEKLHDRALAEVREVENAGLRISSVRMAGYRNAVQTYQEELSEFVQKLRDPVIFQDWSFWNLGRAGKKRAQLMVRNDGSKPAREVRIRLPLPPWLYAWTEEEPPETLVAECVPQLRRPEKPKRPEENEAVSRGGSSTALSSTASSRMLIAKPASLDLIGKHLSSFGSDLKIGPVDVGPHHIDVSSIEVLQKDSWAPAEFYLAVATNVSEGEYVLNGEYVSEEDPDWREFEVTIDVRNTNK